jgi:1-deoxy-D-xylulose-5-phosphate reductoisomerase
LAWDAARAGGTSCGVLSAANEAAVLAFLNDELAFTEIPRVIEETLGRHIPVAHPSLEQILDADRWARRTAGALIRETKRIVHTTA